MGPPLLLYAAFINLMIYPTGLLVHRKYYLLICKRYFNRLTCSHKSGGEQLLDLLLHGYKNKNHKKIVVLDVTLGKTSMGHFVMLTT